MKLSKEKVKKNENHIKSKQFLSFVVASEEYALPILTIKEIRGWEKPTSVPTVEKYLTGVINLRGEVIPIINLRELFSLPKIELSDKNVVVIIQLEETTIGIIVDAVSEVYDITTEMIKSSPHEVHASEKRKDFIQGLATINEKMIILVNIEEILNGNQQKDIKNIIDKFKKDATNGKL